ncbi:hypothetical protein MHBO_001930 [Bonamia ostreae]|uniref:VWFA domain-containing protein n=1 Tax=Bonamia ostreae TaxID=126728 RepID=A0ABV2AKN5_9EUKA
MQIVIFFKPVSNCAFNIAYCIDGSGSITQRNPDGFLDEKNFVIEYNNEITKYSGEPFLKSTAVGFANNYAYYFEYNDYSSTEEVDNAISKIKQPSDTGGTKIGGCMHEIYKKARPNDLAIVLLVVTDGMPNHDTYNISEMSEKMRSDNYFIQAAGFNNANLETLTEITGNPDMVIYSNKIEDLDKQLEKLTTEICEELYVCKEPPSVPRATQESLDKCYNKTVGNICPVECETDYKLNDTSAVICQKSGDWLPAVECVGAYDCPKGPQVENAEQNSIDACNKKNEGYTCEITCLSNFLLNGDYPVCQSSGKWDPMCECVSDQICPNPPNVENALDTTKCADSQVGAECEVECKDGYHLNNTYPVCQEGGGWKPTVSCLTNAGYDCQNSLNQLESL